MALPPPALDATVLVTGASTGIGAELARELARRGYGLTLAARTAERLDTLAAELRAAHGVTVEVEALDLADRDARAELVARLQAGSREVAGVCNNAGFGNTGTLVDADLAKEQQMVALNVDAVHHLTAAFLPAMVGAGQGAVLNVASTAAFQPLPGFATYAATKAFVASFSEAVHAELRGTGVSVTSLCPGPTRTEFGERAGIGEAFSRAPSFVVMAPGPVAKAGIEGMVEGRRSVVPGVSNKLSGIGGRFVPRSVLLPVAARLG